MDSYHKISLVCLIRSTLNMYRPLLCVCYRHLILKQHVVWNCVNMSMIDFMLSFVMTQTVVIQMRHVSFFKDIY